MVNDQSVINSKEVTTLEETLTIGVRAPLSILPRRLRSFDSEGRVNGLIGISRDITNYKRVEAALRETDARLREAQRIAKLGSWSWEPIPEQSLVVRRGVRTFRSRSVDCRAKLRKVSRVVAPG